MTTAQIWTLVVAISGFVLACASLAWQAYAFKVSGARVKASLMVGTVSGNSWMANPVKEGKWQGSLASWERQDLPAMFGVEVTNTGRQAITVSAFSTDFDSGPRMGGGEHRGPKLPHRLEANDHATFLIPTDFVVEAVNLLKTALRPEAKQPTEMRVSVALGNGKTVKTPERIRWSELTSWAGDQPVPDPFRPGASEF